MNLCLGGGCWFAHLFVWSFCCCHCWFLFKFCCVSFFAQGRCCKTTGKKSNATRGSQCTWGFLKREIWFKQKGEGHLFLPLEKIRVVSLTSRSFSKGASKIPDKTPNSLVFRSSSAPVVMTSSPGEVRYAVKRVSRQNPWVLSFQCEECLDL